MYPFTEEASQLSDGMKDLETKVDQSTGLRVHRVEVTDGYEGEVRERALFQGVLAEFEEHLRQNPEITVDSELNEGRMYLKSNETINAWMDMMPSAMALYPLQRPDEKYLPNGVKVSAEARNLFRHSQDAVGIRSRAQIMKELVSENAQKGDIDWLSLACGAAVPVLDAVRELPETTDAKLTLVDFDPQALEFARTLATDQGLMPEKDFHIEASNLVKDLIFKDNFIEKHGEESFDMVDMLGIFEYFDEERGAKLLQNAYRLVKPGGKMIIGNMLDTHPTLELNQRAVGWPGIKPRSLEEISQIVEQAGIEGDNVDVYIPQDGVYAVLEIKKPESETPSNGTSRPIGTVALKA